MPSFSTSLETNGWGAMQAACDDTEGVLGLPDRVIPPGARLQRSTKIAERLMATPFTPYKGRTRLNGADPEYS